MMSSSALHGSHIAIQGLGYQEGTRAPQRLWAAPGPFTELYRGGGEVDEETEAPVSQLSAIDRATLTPLVRSALLGEAVEVTSWECEQLHGGAGTGNAVYRVFGQGHD